MEQPGAGIDTVRATITFALGSSLENLRLIGTAAINGTGNDQSNRITGNGSANTLNGLQGNDTMTGGAGADRFVFSTGLGASNVDTITDFNTTDDTIRLDDTVFTGLALGGLSATAFQIGNTVTGQDTRILYNAATGQLFFDADGQGGTGRTLFALLDSGLALTAADFSVF